VALALILIVGLAAGFVSGVVGTGASIMLVPVLVHIYGPKAAIPIMAVAAVMLNVSRILVWWREIDWRAFAAYAVTGVPSAIAGAHTMLALPASAVDLAIAIFLLAMIPGRRWFAARLIRLQLAHLALAGAIVGFLTGIVASTGPASVPVFLGYGLTKGAFLGTEGAGSLAIYITKALTFQHAGVLPIDELMKGLAVGASLMAGTWIAKPFVLRLSPDAFRYLMDGLLLLAGLSLLWDAAARPLLAFMFS
jgi:uncharacterized membrane protein YfcA